ncbi:hypothetical protein MNBD_GAMMA12-2309 [hydrothermal vent metagenome]|uniref:Uncharacterized protein n=1 Tax=hydrothermal vent metagenome TaxID=652676 RepID=A0A3B0ZDX5_9ZZZZ
MSHLSHPSHPSHDNGMQVKKSNKYFSLILSALALIVVTIILFSFLMVFNRHEQQSSILANNLRLTSQTIVLYGWQSAVNKHLGVYSSHAESPFNLLRIERKKFEVSLNKLIKGDEVTGLPAADSEKNGQLKNRSLVKINALWKGYNQNITRLLKVEKSIKSAHQSVRLISRLVPDMTMDINEILENLVENRASGVQIHKASLQLMLLERIDANVNRLLVLNDDVKATDKQGAAGRFSRDAVIFQTTLNGMLNGDKSYNIQRIHDTETRNILIKLKIKFRDIGDNLTKLTQQFTDLSHANKAAINITLISRELYRVSSTLVKHYEFHKGLTFKFRYGGLGVGIVAVLFLLAWLLVGANLQKVPLSSSRDYEHSLTE